MSKEAGFKATRGVRASRAVQQVASGPHPGPRPSQRADSAPHQWESPVGKAPPTTPALGRPAHLRAPGVASHPGSAPRCSTPADDSPRREAGAPRQCGEGGRERRAGRGRGSRAIGRGFRCCDWNPSIWRRSAAAARWRTSEYEVKPAAALATPRARCPPPRRSTCPGPWGGGDELGRWPPAACDAS